MELKNFSEAIAWCEKGLQIDSKEKKLLEVRAKADKLKVNTKADWCLQCLSPALCQEALWDPWLKGAPNQFLCSLMSPDKTEWWFHIVCAVEMCRGKSQRGPFGSSELISPLQGRAVMGVDLLCVTMMQPFFPCSELRSGMQGKQR